VSEPLVELTAIVKDFRGLRPLRIEHLTLAPGEQVAILGIDRAAAEVLVNLVTGATLPDRGSVRLFGRDSASIAGSEEWLALLDRFGIVSARAVLLEALTVLQNLAVPFSLDIEPLAPGLRERAASAGREVGLPDHEWDRRVSSLDGVGRVRVRLARALALEPTVVLIEHPTADVAREDAAPLGRDIRALLERRGTAGLTLTADPEFAAASSRVLEFDPARGRLVERRRGWLSNWGV